MKFKTKSRGLLKKLGALTGGDSFWLAVESSEHEARIAGLGFSTPPLAGERLLPGPESGSASDRNANGYEIVHRDQEMETAFRQTEWHWTEFRGRYDSEEKSKIVDVPYNRYPRTVVEPFAVELECKTTPTGTFVVAGPFKNIPTEDACATNSANMFVEIFGEFQILRGNLTRWLPATIRHLNWELLPPGRNPWQSAKPAMKRVVDSANETSRPVIQARLETIGDQSPEFIAVGRHGFDGYLAFGFPSLGFCVLESRNMNNATYVLNDADWERISTKTKAEILDASMHLDRFIHRVGWTDAVKSFVEKAKRKTRVAA